MSCNLVLQLLRNALRACDTPEWDASLDRSDVDATWACYIRLLADARVAVDANPGRLFHVVAAEVAILAAHPEQAV